MEIIKSDRYTQNDLQVYLKRRVKNMGLLSKVITPHNGYYVNRPSANGNYIFYNTFNGSNYILLRTDMNFNLVNTISSIPETAGLVNSIATFDNNSCFCSSDVNVNIPRVFLANISGEITKIDTETKGTNTNQWNNPGQMAISEEGELYVCDRGNNRVKVYDYGVYSAKVTTPSSSECIASDDLGYVYCYDNTAKKIKKYTHALVLSTDWTVTGGLSNMVVDMVVDKVNNKLYTVNLAQGKVTSFNLDGSGEMDLITGVSIKKITTDGTYIYLSNDGADIYVYTVTGIYVKTLTKIGATFISLATYNGLIYALNGNDITIFNIDGTEKTISVLGFSITTARRICIDTRGLIYITDSAIDSVIKCNSEGKYITVFGTTGSGDGQLSLPISLTYNTYNNKIVVSDYSNTRLQSFQYGSYRRSITAFVGTSFNTPNGICFDSNNNFYIHDLSSTIFKFSVSPYPFAPKPIKSYSIGDTNVFGIYYNLVENSIYITLTTGAKKYNLADDFTKYYYLGYEETGATNFFTYGNYAYNTMGNLIVNNALIYRYEITPDYDGEWINITQDIINKDLELKYTTEESNFSLGKVDIGDFNIELLNVNDKYDFETNPDSIFYSATGIYQRNNSLIKIELKGTELSRMLIDGKNITNKELTISFKLYNPFKYFETVGSTTIKTSLSDGDTISDVIPFLVNNRFFEHIIEFSASDIDIYYDAVINDVSELPDNCFDLLKSLSQMGKFKFGIYAGRKFYANNIIDKMALRTADYLITENNLLDVSSYNNGEHRLFKNVEIKYTTGTATYTIPEEVQLCFNEDRTVSFDLACITSSVIAQKVADDFANFSSWASKEIEIKIPILNYDNNLFDKVYAFNIFDSTRGFKFNTASLNPGGDVLPTKESATQNGRLLYYPLSVRHKVGREFVTILKLKEFIGEAL